MQAQAQTPDYKGHKHYETAKRAHNWTSHVPEVRAAQECSAYDQMLAAATYAERRPRP